MNAVTLLLALVSAALNAAAQICLRRTALSLGPVPGGRELELVAYGVRAVSSASLMIGAACYVLSLAVWLAVLSRAEVSVAYPLLSIGYVIAAVASFVFLGETITVARAFGIALICAGMIFIARSA